jgi:hypothetical protein
MLTTLIAHLENLSCERTIQYQLGAAVQAVLVPAASYAAKYIEAWKKTHASQVEEQQAAQRTGQQSLLERHFAKLRIPAPLEIQATLIQIRRGGGLPAYMSTHRQGDTPCQQNSTTNGPTATENSEPANRSAPSTSATPTAPSPGQS